MFCTNTYIICSLVIIVNYATALARNNVFNEKSEKIGLADISVSNFGTLENELKSSEDHEKEGKLWVVLAAGSWSWINYRHQADVCHAYQIVKKHGIPDERVVVFMKDDIAYNKQNPSPGVIRNQPNGTNVYDGVPKDYTNENLNFLNVLSGKEMNVGSRKNLKNRAK